MNNTELLQALMEKFIEKELECAAYKFKLAEMQRILNSDVAVYREGTIQDYENE